MQTVGQMQRRNTRQSVRNAQMLEAKVMVGATNPSADWKHASMPAMLGLGLVAKTSIAHGRTLTVVASSAGDLDRLCRALLPPQTKARAAGDPPPMAIGNCVAVVDRERMTITVRVIRGIVSGGPLSAWHVHDTADGEEPQCMVTPPHPH